LDKFSRSFAAMNNTFRFWVRISLFNFLVVALLGVTLRYKIAFYLPIVDQKHLLHAHSHFAFTGWITQVLMVLMVYYLSSEKKDSFKRYKSLLYANLVTAYGMLFSFPFEGYGLISISFSTLSIFVSYWFAIKYWRDLNKLPKQTTTHLWFKAATLFSVISSLGAFALAFMMATKTIHQNWYLASTYFFLHFQYNGWFLFACAGIFNWLILKTGIHMPAANKIFWFFATACIPAYFLSALWLPMSPIVYIIVVIAACLQMIGWVLFVLQILPQLKLLGTSLHPLSKWLLGLSSAALTIKLLLQLGSTIPVLSNLAFGFRPIVIGYLHLVLLAVISLFIIASLCYFKIVSINRLLKAGIITLATGVLLNELLLMIQGTAAMSYNNIPFTNELLFAVAVIMFCGIAAISYSQMIYKDTDKA
jgi:hypothetical protein